MILGAGTLGTHAARAFLGAGARVIALDRDVAKLQRLDEMFGCRVTTMLSHSFNIRKVVTFADVLVGAVLVPGARTPILVRRELVASMRPRSLIMDLSVDQGGCVETSQPTTQCHLRSSLGDPERGQAPLQSGEKAADAGRRDQNGNKNRGSPLSMPGNAHGGAPR